MDFLERYFGFFRDHSDGSLEAIILVALGTAVFGLGLTYYKKHYLPD